MLEADENMTGNVNILNSEYCGGKNMEMFLQTMTGKTKFQLKESGTTEIKMTKRETRGR